MKATLHHSIRVGAVGIFLWLLLASSAAEAVRYQRSAERYDDSAFYLGARMVGSTLHGNATPDSSFSIAEDGGGLQFFLGYRFDTGFSLQLDLSGAAHETSDPDIDAGVVALQFFVQYRFARGHWFRPYLKGGFGGYGLGVSDGNARATISGGGVAFGGGFDFFLNRHFSLGLDLTHNIIDYNKIEVELGGATYGLDIDDEGSNTTVGLAATVYF